MSAEEHRQQAAATPLDAAVITVSSTRTEADDHTGAALVAGLAQAGHRLAHRQIVDDDIAAIRQAVSAQVDAGVALVLLTGGTGLTPRDVTPEALRPLLTRELPGFGELFRVLSYAQVGAAAMLSRALGGVIGRTVVFALPGSRKACQLALDDLILPEAAHLVHLVRKQEVAARPGHGWQAAVAAVGGRLHRDAREPVPAALARIPEVAGCLAGAGELAVVEVDEWRYALFGFPDLQQAASRVIALSAGGPVPEVVALHRFPAQVGTCVKGEGGWVTSRDRSVAEVAGALTGRPPPAGGALFAVAEGIVYIEREARVTAWDGRATQDLGSPAQALAQLVPAWAAR